MALSVTASGERLFHLRRRFRSKIGSAHGLLDAAPWVNVVLLIFLFFMVNSAFVIQPGIVLNLPVSPTVEGTRYGSMIVTVSKEGLVFFNDERTTLDGLAASFAQRARKDPDATLVIEADGAVQHGTLVTIYNMALAAGIKEALLATRLPPGEAATP